MSGRASARRYHIRFLFATRKSIPPTAKSDTLCHACHRVRWRTTLGSKFVTERYVPGWNHSRFRPNLYQHLEMWQGTINIQLPAETDERILIPNERVIGYDQIDVKSNQDFLVRRCRLKGILGYQILPIDKTMNVPRGYHAVKRIEVTLKQKIDLQHGEELEVELQGFED
jgi:hypothetical protein